MGKESRSCDCIEAGSMSLVIGERGRTCGPLDGEKRRECRPCHGRRGKECRPWNGGEEESVGLGMRCGKGV